MKTVTSKDGTTIAFDQLGAGAPVILVDGATGTRSHPNSVQQAEMLSQYFTVFNYDRRGRGDSTDMAPYAIDREIEDIDALIDAAGGSACVYGISSGAVLAVRAASKLSSKVKKLALYEPPFILDDSRPPLPADYVAQLNAAIKAGERSKAAEIFLIEAVGIPEPYVAGMRADPSWVEMEKVAHTISYDGTIMADTMSGKPLSAEFVKQVASASMPTLVMNGGNSMPFFDDAAQALTKLLPHAEHRTLAGQDHGVANEVLVPILVEFFR